MKPYCINGQWVDLASVVSIGPLQGGGPYPMNVWFRVHCHMVSFNVSLLQWVSFERELEGITSVEERQEAYDKFVNAWKLS